jgi:hypothetical protein
VLDAAGRLQQTHTLCRSILQDVRTECLRALSIAELDLQCCDDWAFASRTSFRNFFLSFYLNFIHQKKALLRIVCCLVSLRVLPEHPEGAGRFGIRVVGFESTRALYVAWRVGKHGVQRLVFDIRFLFVLSYDTL